MPIEFLLGSIIGKTVVEFVCDAASQTICNFLNREMSGHDQMTSLPTTIQDLRVTPWLYQEELAYGRRRELRERELLAIQAEMQIEAAKAEREERALQLKEQELSDRRQMSALYLEVLRQQTAQSLEIKRQEIQTMFDQQHWPVFL